MARWRRGGEHAENRDVGIGWQRVGRNTQGLTVDQPLANWQEKSDSVAANSTQTIPGTQYLSQPVRQTFSVDIPRA
jgi:hypothetical protein